VDVVVLTKNSQRILKSCLDSIFANVPVNRLIVVDGYSTDSTIDIVHTYEERCGNVVLIEDNGTRGSARLRGVEEVQTDWFVFVDSDVILCTDWFNKAKRCVERDVGGVWGTEVWAGLHNPTVLKLFLMVTRKIFELRGGTHDLLVRSEAVKGIDIPMNLHVFEDAYIRDWMLRKGYRVVPTYVPFCLHYRPKTVWTFKGSRNLFVEALRYGSLKKMPEYFLAYGFYTLYVACRGLMERQGQKDH
jgi:glycosyltransferase involved in cell wall biosynthesis